MLTMFRRTRCLLDSVRCCTSLRTNEAVIKKKNIKGRSPTMRHVSRTHRLALDWLFHRINLDNEIQSKYIDTKRQLADILTQGNFTREQSSSFVQHQSFQLHLLRSEFQLDELLQNDGEEGAGTGGRRKNCGVKQSPPQWTWHQLSRQVPHPWKIWLHHQIGRNS